MSAMCGRFAGCRFGIAEEDVYVRGAEIYGIYEVEYGDDVEERRLEKTYTRGKCEMKRESL